MEIISEFFIRQFINRQLISPDKKEIYKTGLNLIIADIINFTLVLTIGVITKSLINSCIYLIMFWTLRRFSGGFHARTYGVCRLVTLGTYILILLVSNVLNNFLVVSSVICSIITIVTMIVFAPIRHPNKELTENEVKANKLFSVVVTIFYVTISIILTIIGRKEGIVIALVLLAISVLMYIGLYTNGKEVRKNVQ